ncbi:hypothetical protein FA95DRAFT_1684441, partial [Auriscalpium vulgare]
MHVFKSLKKIAFRRAQHRQVTVQDPSPYYEYEDPSQARATLGTVVALLREIGEISAQVPYIKGVAGVLLRIIVISDTLSANHDQWKEVNDNVKQLVTILAEALQFTRDHVWIIPPDLQNILRLWLQELESIANILDQYQYQLTSVWRRFSLLLTQKQVTFKFRYCNETLKMLSKSYQFSLASTIQATKEENPTINRTYTNLPARPSVFYGRDSYMVTILAMIENKNKLPIRAGILGPGGIGKTTLALAILHHPIVEQTFNERVYFVSCEGCLSISMLVKDLAQALGIRNDLDRNAIEKNVLSCLGSSPNLLCFDNFETLWNSDQFTKCAVQTFLKRIASLKDTSFVITMRGLEYPEEILWSHPLLPPLKPLSFEASKYIFRQLSNQWDEWTEKLVKAVEGLPLAITIIGHLAQSCDCKSLWKQW